MTSTAIRPTDHLVPTGATPTSRRRLTGRSAALVLAGMVAVAGVSAGAAYAARYSSDPVAVGGGQASAFGDARESAHGTRAGVDTGNGIPVALVPSTWGSDTATVAHGAPGSITTGAGRRMVAIASVPRN